MLKLPAFPATRLSLPRVAAIVGAMFGVAAMGATAPADPLSLKPDVARTVLRIVAFGSSSTEGVGASSPAASYPARLQAILAQSLPKGTLVQVVNKGIGGDDVDDMMKRLQPDILSRRPDVVIWQTGSNDPLRHVSVAHFDTETRAGVLAMQRAGIVVILMEPQWCPRIDQTTADEFRAVLRSIGRDAKVAVIHRGDMMQKWAVDNHLTRSQMLAPDGLHMNDISYALLARDIAPEVLAASLTKVPTIVPSKPKAIDAATVPR